MYHSGVGCWYEGPCVCVVAGGTWELSVLSAQFFCEPKTALKNKFDLKTHTHTHTHTDGNTKSIYKIYHVSAY